MPDDRILIFDTTLRDGEQCPGAAMTQPQAGTSTIGRSLATISAKAIKQILRIATSNTVNLLLLLDALEV
jgi:hypothetical protein